MGLGISTISKWGTQLGKTTSKGLRVFSKKNAAGEVLTTLNAENKVIRTTLLDGQGGVKATTYNPLTGMVRERIQVKKVPGQVHIKRAAYADNCQEMPLNFSTKTITREADGISYRVTTENAGDFSGGKIVDTTQDFRKTVKMAKQGPVTELDKKNIFV